MSSADAESVPVSEEAKNETRDLRVSHTMVGSMAATTVPMPAVNPAEMDPSYAVQATAPVPSVSPGEARVYSEGPIELPTTGLAPRWVGAIVVVSLLVVALVGIFLLR
jgi:hypothetical protein